MIDTPTLNYACSWSGGKDSCYALMQALKKDALPRVLVNMMNENGIISRSHGLTLALLKEQADAMQLPIIATPSSWKDYEGNFISILSKVKLEYAIDAMVFGDIDLQAHRDWEEMVCEKAGIQAVLPIWKRDHKELFLEMLDAGITAMIVSCNEVLGESFLGRWLSRDIISELEDRGVDVCGENGEYHTIVTDCPLFNRPVLPPPYSTTKNEGYHFISWQ